MKKTITLLLTLMVSTAFAQVERAQGEIMKTEATIEIDGVAEAAWETAIEYNIDRIYGAETPSVGAAGETTWKALWHKDGIYVFVTVADDTWFPRYMASAGDEWTFDKVEIYFDVNYEKADAKGPSTAGSGHYQVAPQPVESDVNGTPVTWDSGVVWAYNVTAPKYNLEVFVPWNMLKDADGNQFFNVEEMGFDVCVIDRDAEDGSRQRMVWSNNSDPENYSNMDDAGRVIFDGVEDLTYIDSITLTGGTITADNQPLQVVADILPADATVKILKWSIKSKDGNGRATISNTGVVTPILDGVVTVTADATDGSYEQASVDVVITGQVPTVWELNLVKNGLFNEVNETNGAVHWGGWVDGGYGAANQVVEGAAVLAVAQAHETEAWHYQFSQSGFKAVPNVPYTLSFVAWADAPRVAVVDFEDTDANGYNRYGASSSPASAGGRSEWTFDLTTEPQTFEFDVTFDQIVETTVEKVQFLISQAAVTMYVDSVLLINNADLALIPAEGDVMFNVDMSGAANFNPATDKVYITGTVIDPEWAAPGAQVEQQLMTRVGETLIYTKTINLEAGDYAYKYFLNDGWDGGEWQGEGNDRVITVGTEAMSVSDIFGSQVNVNNPVVASVKVYPNPARSSFTVTSDSQINNLVISDLTGKVVYSNAVNHTQVNINNQFENGIYIVRVFTQEGVTVSKLQVIR